MKRNCNNSSDNQCMRLIPGDIIWKKMDVFVPKLYLLSAMEKAKAKQVVDKQTQWSSCVAYINRDHTHDTPCKYHSQGIKEQSRKGSGPQGTNVYVRYWVSCTSIWHLIPIKFKQLALNWQLREGNNMEVRKSTFENNAWKQSWILGIS